MLFELTAKIAGVKLLLGYSYFYKMYDDGIADGLSIDDAFERARRECIKEGYLQNYKETLMVLFKNGLELEVNEKQAHKLSHAVRKRRG